MARAHEKVPPPPLLPYDLAADGAVAGAAAESGGDPRPEARPARQVHARARELRPRPRPDAQAVPEAAQRAGDAAQPAAGRRPHRLGAAALPQDRVADARLQEEAGDPEGRWRRRSPPRRDDSPSRDAAAELSTVLCPNSARGAFSSGPHGRVAKKNCANFLDC